MNDIFPYTTKIDGRDIVVKGYDQHNDHKPVSEYRTILDDSGNSSYVNRLLVGTATTGLLRVEWVQARYGQVIPMNWSQVEYMQFMDSFIPLRYQVDDAQNLIVKAVIEGDFVWLLLLEHDVILPPDGLIQLNQYIRKADVPIVSGLYYGRSRPSEPLVFRGRGTSVYTDWELGDKVWCDGVPTGCLLIHNSILKTMWNESEEYELYGQKTRRVFKTPRDVWFDPESGHYNILSGTSDLAWSTRVMVDNVFEKAGWKEFAGKEYPFLVDTNLFCRHIDMDGTQYP